MSYSKSILFSLALIAAATLTGCGSGKLKTEAVHGKVTMDGAPVVGASVTFSPTQQGQGSGAVGVTDDKGEYELQTFLGEAGAGSTPGEYIVTVSKVDMEKTGVVLTDSEGKKTEQTKPKELLPLKTANRDSSDLKANIEKGKPNNFDFDLKK